MPGAPPLPPPLPPPPETAIAWDWAIETLADCKDFSSSILGALISWIREVRNELTFGPSTRERVALRYLEDRLDSTRSNDAAPPPLAVAGSPGSGRGIDVALPSEVVLNRDLLKVATSNNFEDWKDELYRNNLHQFIIQKRAGLPKSSLDLVKDYILEECRQATSPLRRFRDLARGYPVGHLHSGSDDEYEIASKKHKLNNGEIETPELTTMSSPNSCSSHGSRQQPSKQSLAFGLYNGLTDTNNDNICSVEQRFIPELSAGRVEKPKDRSPGETENDKDQALSSGIPTGGAHNGTPEPLSNGDTHHVAAPKHGPNDETLVSETLKLRSSQNLVDRESQLSDWSQQSLCIKCDKEGQLLICTASGCPIAVHESCLGLSVGTEDLQNFKCPFCSYFQAAAAYSEAKKKVTAARKVLSSFMDWVPMLRNNKTSTTEVIGSSHARNSGSRNCPDKVHAKGISTEMINEIEQQERAVDNNSEHPPCREEEPTLVGRSNDVSSGTMSLDIMNDSQSNIPAQYQQQEDAVIPSNSNIIHQKMVTSPTENHDVPLIKEDVRIDDSYQCIGLATHHQHTECASAFTNVKLSCREENTSGIKEICEGSLNNGKTENSERLNINRHVQELKNQQPAEVVMKNDMGNLHCQETTTVVHGKSARRRRNPLLNNALDAQGNFRNYGVKKSSSSKNRILSVKRYTNPVSPSGRRNRLPWTPEEEEVLKDAMKKFSEGVENKISWTKILEFGRHIFHRTRQPMDLKDKWKNIMKKVGSET